MFKNGIALALVEDIPERIQLNSAEANDRDVLRVVEVVPRKKPVRYNDDIWDFSDCFIFRKEARYTIDFRRVPESIKDPLKDFVLSLIENGAKITSACTCFYVARTVLKGLLERKGGIFELITAEDIIAWVMARENKYSTKRSHLSLMTAFFLEMTNNGFTHLVDVEALRNTEKRIAAIAKHEKVGHYPVIPESFLNKMISMFDSVMRDESKPFDQRMTAGIMLLESQLGLRSSEIVALPDDCLHYWKTSKGMEPYITYRSIKAARGPHEVKYVDHIATDLAIETLNYYQNLRKQCSHANEPFLYVDERLGHYPIKTHELLRRFRYLVKMYIPEAVGAIEGIQSVKLRRETISCPAIHSFRVTVFTKMAECGIPYPFIEKMMSHTPQSKTDEGYYSGVKTANTVWEDITNN